MSTAVGLLRSPLPLRRNGAMWVALIAANGCVLAALALSPAAGIACLAVALVIPFGIALVRTPQLGVLVLVALAPFNGLLLIIPHPGIVNGWKEALVVATLVTTFLTPQREAHIRPGRPPWVYGLLGFGLVAVLAAARLGDPVRAVLGLKVTFFYALVAWTLIRCPLTPRHLDRLVSILMATGVVVSIVGIAQQAIGPVRLNALGFPYNTTIRFSGGFFRSFSTFIQPFGFGFYVMAVLLVCGPVALSDRRRTRNLLFLAATPLLVAGIATSVVRGALLGLAVGIAYLGGHRHRLLLLLFPLGLVMLLVLPPDITSAALSTSSGQERAAGWQENLNVITSHPLGAGPGTSAAVAERLQGTGINSTTRYQPDNYFYHVTYEEGPLGLWFFGLLLAAGFFSTRRRSARLGDLDDGPFARGASAFLVAATAASLVASFFEIFPMDVLLWVVLGTAAVGPVGGAAPAVLGGPTGIGALGESDRQSASYPHR